MYVMTSCALRPARRARNAPAVWIPSCELPAKRMTASRICSGRRSARPAEVGVADSGKTGEELTVWGLRTLIEQVGRCQCGARKWNSRKKAQKAQKEVGRKSRRANGRAIQPARIRAGFEPSFERPIVEDYDRSKATRSMIDSNSRATPVTAMSSAKLTTRRGSNPARSSGR